MKNRYVRFASWMLALACIAGSVSYAQVAGQFTGTITDPSGAVIPGATVVVVKEDTGIKSEAKTNRDGIYTLPFLQPGEYRIEVQASGFRPMSRAGVTLDVTQTATIDFKLQLGTTSEAVTVTDTAPLLNTSSSAMGGPSRKSR